MTRLTRRISDIFSAIRNSLKISSLKKLSLNFSKSPTSLSQIPQRMPTQNFHASHWFHTEKCYTFSLYSIIISILSYDINQSVTLSVPILNFVASLTWWELLVVLSFLWFIFLEALLLFFGVWAFWLIFFWWSHIWESLIIKIYVRNIRVIEAHWQILWVVLRGNKWDWGIFRRFEILGLVLIVKWLIWWFREGWCLYWWLYFRQR